MEVAVEMDGMELIGSQIIHVSSSRFEMNVDGVKIKVKFFTDSTGTRWEFGPDEESIFSIGLYNFKSRVGIGKLKPVLAGRNDEFALYITFVVETVDAESDERIVSFNFFKRTV
jgi:hypothetical protein